MGPRNWHGHPDAPGDAIPPPPPQHAPACNAPVPVGFLREHCGRSAVLICGHMSTWERRRGGQGLGI